MQGVSAGGHNLAVFMADKILTAVEEAPGAGAMSDDEQRNVLTLIAAKLLTAVVES